MKYTKKELNVAAQCWVNRIEENLATVIVRAAIADLQEYGHFKYDIST